MMFHTVAFILAFLPVCVAGFFAIGRFGGPPWALRWLVASSLFFYGWWRPEHLFLLIGSVAVNHTIAGKIRISNRPRAWVAGGITLNLSVLGWFKYADFLLHSVAPTATPLGNALPLAISFFTFQQIMFLVDTGRARDVKQTSGLSSLTNLLPHPASQITVGPAKPNADQDRRPVEATSFLSIVVRLFRSTYSTKVARTSRTMADIGRGLGSRYSQPDNHRGAFEVKPNHDTPETKTIQPTNATPAPFLPYVAFVTFFPHLIAGPIVRPSDILPQLTAPNLASPNRQNLADGLLIFLLGLGKKLVLADMFGGFADVGFDAAAHGATLTFFEAWYATLSYALQIYFDFSGYSDMAIGLARMLNVHFPLNFDSPYKATDIAAFWRRWHITLGAFLRDYLYIPLGGNRTGPLRQTASLMATMLLAGLWHGAAWNFVIWGGLHGAFLVIHTQYRRLFPPMPVALAHAITLLAVILAWVPFRAASLSATTSILFGMAGHNGIALPRMIVSAIPGLAAMADPVAVMPFLGGARTLSFPEVSACLMLGWLIVLTLPNVHRMTQCGRHWTLAGSFAFSVQALFFAPHIAPFLYFQF
jgi:alginate O-acetyltransferase complex protein AlgI